MRYLPGGYTVVEVMLFLVISGIIFAGAAFVFNGQQSKTAFEQGMRDLASQMQKYVDDVSTSLFLGGDKYSCAVSSSTGRAVLSAGGSSLGSNQDCIFLGRAVQVVPTQQMIYIYSVLGNKSTSDGEAVTTFANAMPEPAFSNGADLTDTYFTAWGKVASSKITDTSGAVSDSDLVGFYNSLQDGFQNSGVTGAQAVFAKGYSFQSTDTNSARSPAIKSCIEEQNANGVTCANTPVIKSWDVCFSSTRSDQTAILAMDSTPAGITTDVNFTSCS